MAEENVKKTEAVEEKKTEEAAKAETKTTKNSSDNGLTSEVNGFTDEVSQAMKAREASLSLGTKLRAIALVIIVLYFGFIYSMICKFTADEAMLMINGQLDAELPKVQAETIESMKKQAPQVVEDFANQCVGEIPSLSKMLQDQILGVTGDYMKEMESGLNEMMGQMINDAKTELDKMGKDKSTAEKVDLLSKHMELQAFDLRKEAVKYLSEDFSKDMKKLDDELKRLQKGQNLNKKEKEQRELLRVWSKLMQIKMKDVNADFQRTAEELSKQDVNDKADIELTK